MEKYTFEMDKDTKDRIENFIKAYDLDVNINKAEQPEEEQWPQVGDFYYFINSAGYCDNDFFFYNSERHSALHERRLAFGNCFRTKDEAVFEMERLIVINEMKKFAEPEDRVWDVDNAHWIIYAAMFREEDIRYDSNISKKYGDIYFESLEKAKECVEAVGADRIKKYYLRIKE